VSIRHGTLFVSSQNKSSNRVLRFPAAPRQIIPIIVCHGLAMIGKQEMRHSGVEGDPRSY
jgi:hypothetical protein